VENRIVSLVVDAADAELLAQFWAGALGWQVVNRGSYGVSIGAEGSPFEIDFRSVPDGPKPVKNRLHLDVKPLNRDQQAELDRLLALGARQVDVGQGKPSWYVLADPEGNEFCLCRP
jgi:catechol-2,3-dioxygenase